MDDAAVNVAAMDEEIPRSKDNVLAALTGQDLDQLSVGELDARIATLDAELARTRARRDGASAFRSAADALFRR